MVIKADNQGAIASTEGPRFHSRTKHIDIQWHFFRDQVETGAVRFEWIPTKDLVANGLTYLVIGFYQSPISPQSMIGKKKRKLSLLSQSAGGDVRRAYEEQ